MNELSTEVVHVTPAIANELLKNNTGNYRRLDRSRVVRYSSDMKSGRWDLNGETVKFNCTGELLDGQHRLSAVIRAGVTVPMVFVRGVKSAVNIDVGRPRSVADWLRHEGVSNANVMAAVARLCLIHRKGLWKQKACAPADMTTQEVIDFAGKNREALIDAVRLARRAMHIAPHSTLAAIMHVGSGESMASQNNVCKWFCDALVSGEGLTSSDAVLHLRNRLIYAKSSPAKAITGYMIRVLVTIAWNKTVKGEATKCLKIAFTGPGKSEPPNTIEIANDEG